MEGRLANDQGVLMSGRGSNTPVWILVAVFVGLPALCCLAVAFWPVLTTIGVLSER